MNGWKEGRKGNREGGREEGREKRVRSYYQCRTGQEVSLPDGTVGAVGT